MTNNVAAVLRSAGLASLLACCGGAAIGSNHHAAMTMFLAKTKGRDLVTVRALGEIAPEPGCK
jgi:urea transport system substrate-binding protein